MIFYIDCYRYSWYTTFIITFIRNGKDKKMIGLGTIINMGLIIGGSIIGLTCGRFMKAILREGCLLKMNCLRALAKTLRNEGSNL